MLGSKLAPLRARGLWHVLQKPIADESILETHLLDDSVAVRDAAQRHATQNGRDVAAWYRRRLVEDPRGGLLGLGDVGDQRDDELRALGSALLARTALTWNRSWTTPAPGQIDVMVHLLGHAYPDPLLGEFRAIVRQWRKAT